MPVVKPFHALIPSPTHLEEVVTRPLEHYSTGEARLITSEHPESFLHLIDPALEHQYLRGSRQELVYKKIAENIEQFLEKNYLVRADAPAFYIYRVTFNGIVQTGLWTITHIGDFLNGKIKKHENTVERREVLLAEYLQQTGLDANPVLITYKPDKAITSVITRQLKHQPFINFTFKDGSKHQLWSVTDEEDIELIANRFETMEAVYIADGHHRIASMTKMGLQKAGLNKQHLGTEPYNYFTSVYMDTNQLKVLEFNRLIKNIGSLTQEEFLSQIACSFKIETSTLPVKPNKRNEIGMYMNGQWYRLIPKPIILDDADPVNALDVSILHDHLLAPILNITDPRTDARLKFEGGLIPVEELISQVDQKNYQVAFTLFPIDVSQLMAVADAGLVMPPKSTWVEPKFLVGLLTHYFN